MKRTDDVQFFARWFYIAHGWTDIWLERRLREWSRTGIAPQTAEPTEDMRQRYFDGKAQPETAEPTDG